MQVNQRQKYEKAPEAAPVGPADELRLRRHEPGPRRCHRRHRRRRGCRRCLRPSLLPAGSCGPALFRHFLRSTASAAGRTRCRAAMLHNGQRPKNLQTSFCARLFRQTVWRVGTGVCITAGLPHALSAKPTRSLIYYLALLPGPTLEANRSKTDILQLATCRWKASRSHRSPGSLSPESVRRSDPDLGTPRISSERRAPLPRASLRARAPAPAL